MPGSPLFTGKDEIFERALQDAEILVKGGVSGLIVENMGDRPFFKEEVPPQVVSFMTVATLLIKREFGLPIGVNVLRNDPKAAISIAQATDSEFIRINVHMGAYVTDQGIIEGKASDTLRFRRSTWATSIKIFSDVRVKHAFPLGEYEISVEAEELITRGLSDALIVTGAATGRMADPKVLEHLRNQFQDVPLLVGSGVTPKNIDKFYPYADGFIVGTYFRNGDVNNPVSLERVKELSKKLTSLILEDGF